MSFFNVIFIVEKEWNEFSRAINPFNWHLRGLQRYAFIDFSGTFATMHRKLAQNLHSSFDPLRSIENDSGNYKIPSQKLRAGSFIFSQRNTILQRIIYERCNLLD